MGMWFLFSTSLAGSSQKTIISCFLENSLCWGKQWVTQQRITLPCRGRLFTCCSFSLWNILCNFRWFMCCYIVTLPLYWMHFNQKPLQESKSCCWLVFCWVVLWECVGFLIIFFLISQNLPPPLKGKMGWAFSRRCKQIQVIINPGLSKPKKVRGHPCFKSCKNKVIEWWCAPYWESVAQETAKNKENKNITA